MSFLTNRIQALQHQCKKHLDHKENYVEIETLFGHIPWEYLSQPMNFSANPYNTMQVLLKTEKRWLSSDGGGDWLKILENIQVDWQI